MFDLSIEGKVAVVTMSRAPVNAINQEWLIEFHKTLDVLQGNYCCAVLLIRSGLSVFSAGADLKLIRSIFPEPDGGSQMVDSIRGFHKLFDRIESLPLVTIAEIGGTALGGGLELALSCDLRLAAGRAKLGLPEARLGLLPGAGGTQRLTWLCGKAVASRLILGGEIISGDLAQQLGVVQWSVPDEDLRQKAMDVAQRVAALAPEALAESKSCIAAAADSSRNGFEEELEATRRLFHSKETRERISAFLSS